MKQKSKKGKEAHVSEKKKTLVSELENLIKSKKTILIASIKSIPGSQFQEIVKKLRGKAIVKVLKKGIMLRAIDGSGLIEVKKLKEQVKESTAILFSDIDSFDLAAELISKRSPSKAKSGQIAQSDIEIPSGPTDLVPGPAISELGALGIQIQIEKGKITIKEPKVIAKTGEKISKTAAEMMTKLGIKPFSVGFMPLAAFDATEGKIYFDIQIDKEKTAKDLKESFSKALGFAVSVSYASEDTIKFLIQKAGRQEMALEKIAVGANESRDVNEKKEGIKEVYIQKSESINGSSQESNIQSKTQEEIKNE